MQDLGLNYLYENNFCYLPDEISKQFNEYQAEWYEISYLRFMMHRRNKMTESIDTAWQRYLLRTEPSNKFMAILKFPQFLKKPWKIKSFWRLPFFMGSKYFLYLINAL